MNTITIITIVVVALLTITILGLTGLAYAAVMRSYRLELVQGKHDKRICKEYKKAKGGLVGAIASYAALALLVGLFVTGFVYRVNNENFTINNQTALVIKTGSMSRFYDEQRAQEYNNDTSLQFDIGDICIFETEFELVEGEVYGYKAVDILITHRLLSIDEINDTYRFRGDANATADILVHRAQILYHYTGRHMPVLGAFVLYAQSYFGMWSLLGLITVNACAEVVYHKIAVLERQRYKELEGQV